MPVMSQMANQLKIHPNHNPEAQWQFFWQHLTHVPAGSATPTKYIVPFATLFQEERLKDLKLAIIDAHLGPVPNSTDLKERLDQEKVKEEKSWVALTEHGLTASHMESHPLDGILAFQDYPSTTTRLNRLIPFETQVSSSTNLYTELSFTSFALPVFKMDEELASDDAQKAAGDFQKKNPTTFITKQQIIYAITLWFWIEKDEGRQAEPTRANGQKNKTIKILPVRLGAFIAYFPAWLKFHELFHLGAYGHPYDFISANYTKDLAVSQSYLVRGNDWEKEQTDLYEPKKIRHSIDIDLWDQGRRSLNPLFYKTLYKIIQTIISSF